METKIEIIRITIEVAKQFNIKRKQTKEWEKRLDNTTGNDPSNSENELNNYIIWKLKFQIFTTKNPEAAIIRSKVDW